MCICLVTVSQHAHNCSLQEDRNYCKQYLVFGKVYIWCQPQCLTQSIYSIWKKKNLLNKRINDALLVLGYLFRYISGHSAQSRTSHCFLALEAALKHLRLICLLPVGVAGEGGCAVLASEAIQGGESSTHGDVKSPVPSPRMLRSACKCR